MKFLKKYDTRTFTLINANKEKMAISFSELHEIANYHKKTCQIQDVICDLVYILDTQLTTPTSKNFITELKKDNVFLIQVAEEFLQSEGKKGDWIETMKTCINKFVDEAALRSIKKAYKAFQADIANAK